MHWMQIVFVEFSHSKKVVDFGFPNQLNGNIFLELYFLSVMGSCTIGHSPFNLNFAPFFFYEFWNRAAIHFIKYPCSNKVLQKKIGKKKNFNFLTRWQEHWMQNMIPKGSPKSGFQVSPISYTVLPILHSEIIKHGKLIRIPLTIQLPIKIYTQMISPNS